jgi:hypothetical protein
MMNREMLRDKLVEDRKPRANGVTEPVLPGLREGVVGGKKLKEAASYLDSARKALLHWTRDTCVHADNLETHADHLEETLRVAARIAELKTTIEFKAKLYGENV